MAIPDDELLAGYDAIINALALALATNGTKTQSDMFLRLLKMQADVFVPGGEVQDAIFKAILRAEAITSRMGT